MGRASYFTQLRAILIRNFLIKRYGKRHTIFEILMPLYFIVILIIINIFLPVTNLPPLPNPQTYFPLFNASTLSGKTVGIVGDDGSSWKDITTHLKTFLDKSDASYVHFMSEENMLEEFEKNSSIFQMAVVLQNYTATNISYTIRTMPEDGLPELTEQYATADKCHPDWSDDPNVLLSNELSNGCPARKYYDIGFAQLQTLIDAAIIEFSDRFSVFLGALLSIFQVLPLYHFKNELDLSHILRFWADHFTAIIPNFNLRTKSNGGSGLELNMSVVVFPKDEFKGNTEYLRSFVPIYMSVAFTPFVSYLCILIVGEKEKKIKDAMKLMGLRESVYWLGWMITYGVLVIILSLILSVLLVVANITKDCNIFLLFILNLLYGISTIAIAFLMTPFFDQAKVAGGIASFATAIFSCLYYLAVYVKGIPTGVFYLMALLSPTAYALGMDQVVELSLVAGGLDFDNVWTSGKFCFGSALIMLGVDIVLYGLLAFYFDSVIPGEYGRKLKPWFFLMPSYWFPQPRQSLLDDNDDRLVSATSNNPNFERVGSEWAGKELLRIFNIRKVFSGWRKPKVVAVDGITLDIYQDQITAILGHNGAGKTTLLNMLVGLTTPSSGTATIEGLDIGNPNNYAQIWGQTGICPQTDVLFDELSPRHHLAFFGRIKGVPEENIASKVDAILKDVDLFDRADALASKLSGGQKRKLSIGIALIGDPKIVVLDEPTSGVDPYSRRRIWNLLKKYKQGRVIVLTTHFMDEADILADRKAIVSSGKVKCVGSSLFLKNKFGLGYHLTIVVHNEYNDSAIADLISNHVERASKVRTSANELAYVLPLDDVGKFADLLTALDNEIDTVKPAALMLGIKSYGISMTTLEEVFLKLGDDDEQARHLASANGTNGIKMDHGNGGADRAGFDAYKTLDQVKMEVSWGKAFMAMVTVNMVAVVRQPRQIFGTVILPTVLIILTFWLMSLDVSSDPVEGPVQLDSKMYPDYDLFLTNSSNSPLTQLIEQIAAMDVNSSMYDNSFGDLLNDEPHTFLVNVTDYAANKVAMQIDAAYNDTAQHSLPIMINLLSNALLGLTVATTNHPTIDTYAEPLPRHTLDSAFSGATMGATIMIGMAFSLILAIFTADSVEDRELRVKHQLQVSGLPFSAYWLSKFVANATLCCTALLSSVIVIEIFQVAPFTYGAPLGIFILGYFLFIFAGLAFGYCFGFAFDKYETAQGFLPLLYMIMGFAPYLAVMLCDMLVPDSNSSKIMHYIFTIILPLYSPYSILYFIDKTYLFASLMNEDATQDDYFSSEVITSLVVLPLQAVFFSLLLWLLDFRSSNGQWSEVIGTFQKNKVRVDDIAIINTDVPSNEDDDVKLERERVKNIGSAATNQQPVVIMDGLRKEFANRTSDYSLIGQFKKLDKKKTKKKAEAAIKVAVRNLSLAVAPGEVFALLGPNGAGKTSALKTIVADEIPTKGKVVVAGYDMKHDLAKAIRNMGYCPQHDALWRKVTLREHLKVYASIRGIAASQIDGVINALMDGLQIFEHADKQTDTLSGGTKRKLSYAISMLGNPKIVLLDEPSTGMDPQSKRYLWDTIMSSFQGERGAVLTTHSMEEADILATRVGIMVKGELKCIGSTQHLKNKFGSGYTLEAKIIADNMRDSRHRELDNLIRRLFPHATEQEKFEDRVKYQVAQSDGVSMAQVFRALEQAKSEVGIEEYSFSQTTLEQVFLEFAKEQEIEAEDADKNSENTNM